MSVAANRGGTATSWDTQELQLHPTKLIKLQHKIWLWRCDDQLSLVKWMKKERKGVDNDTKHQNKKAKST